MTKLFDKDGKVKEMIMGEVQIHRHIHYPKSWMITIRPLSIFGKELCKDNLTEKEIALKAYELLKEEKTNIQEMMLEVNKHTA